MKRKILYCLASLLCVFASSAQSPDISFTRSSFYSLSTSSGMNQLLSADFNKDSVMDFIAVNSSNITSTSLTYFKGKADGTFYPHKFFASGGTYATSAAIADVNNDGYKDLLVTNSGTNTVAIMRGLPNDSFYVDTLYTVKKNPTWIVSGYFNLDTLLDFVVSCKDSNSLALFIGNGQGRYSIKYISIPAPHFIAAGNLNGDFYTDIIVAKYAAVSATFTVGFGGDTLLDIKLRTPNSTAAKNARYGLITNLDTTATDEIVISGSFASSGTYMYKVDTSGAVIKTMVLDTFYAEYVCAGDLNKDGKTDLIADSRVIMNKGNGAFSPPIHYMPPNLGLIDGRIADVNRDGKNDFVTLHKFPGSAFCVSMGVGDSGLHLSSLIRSIALPFVNDLNLDRIPDASYMNYSSSSFSNVFYYKGQGNKLPYYPNLTSTKSTLLADINRDSVVDLIYENSARLRIHKNVLASYKDTIFTLNTPINVNLPTSWGSQKMFASNFNKDTLTDIVCVSETAGQVLFVKQLANGTFSVAGTYTTGGQVSDALVTDINNDSISDLVTCSYNGDNMTVLMGDTSPNFKTPLNTSCGDYPTDMDDGDINQDGKIDIVVANFYGTSLSVLTGNGNGTFSSQTLTLSDRPQTVWMGDLNGDGKDDIVAGIDGNPDQMVVFINTGSGTFQSPVSYSLNTAPCSYMIPADFNGDKRMDFGFGGGSNGAGSDMAFMKNNGDGTFSGPLLSYAGNGELRAVDYNGDRKVDIVAWYANTGYFGTHCITNKSAMITNVADTFCGVAVLDAGAGDKYLWSTNDTGRTITVTASGSYWVKITNVDGYSAKSVSRNIVINPMPVMNSITADQAAGFCKGDSAVLTIPKHAGYAYQWFQNKNMLSGFRDTFCIAKITSTFHVLVTNTYGCRDTSHINVTAADTFPVNLNRSVQGNICKGDSLRYFTTIQNSAYKYQWFLNDSVISGADAAQYYANKEGIYSLGIKSGLGCDNVSGKDTLRIDSLSSVLLNKHDTVYYCNGDSVLLSTAFKTSYQYSWYRNGIKLNGVATENYFGKSDAAYYVKVTNGSCNSNSNTVVLRSVGKPPKNISAMGPLSFCSGGSVLLKASPGYIYKWLHNGIMIGGAQDSTYVATASGSYRVIVSNVPGCTDTSNVVSVLVANIHPPAAVSYTGNTAFCQGSTITLNAPSGYQYQWYRNDSAIGGAINQSFLVNNSGSYKVRVKDICDSVSGSVAVTVNPNPPKPVIMITGHTITSSAFTGNQWYYNGLKIDSAISQSHDPEFNGFYYVIVSNIYNCTAKSDSLLFDVSGVESMLNGDQITIFPNPNNGSFSLHASSPVASYEVYSMEGRMVFHGVEKAHNRSIQLNLFLKEGVYLIKVITEQGAGIKKFVVFE